MIYLNNNTEVQEIFIPKQEITAPANPKPTYENGFEDGKKVGFNEGREYQKDQLLNLYVTENGQYEREDGWGVVTVDVPTEGSDCSEAYDKGFEDGYNKGQSECEEVDCSGAYNEGYDKGKNDGYDSGYQDGYNAGQPIKYNTIADIYGSTPESTVTFKGLVALSFAYGSGYYIVFTDHTGSILLRNHQDLLAVGDECVVTAELRRTDSSYISVLFSASVEVLSSNNYVVMPAEAVELTNVDDLYIPNENGYAEMKYLYVDGKVIGSPREDFMRLETVASSKGNIGLRGDFKDWVEKLKEGDSIRVYMFTENSSNNFDVKDIIQLGTEGGSCNLIKEEFTLKGEYEQFTASDYGADGFESVTINASDYGKQKFNEGYEEGKNQGGGESGSCNLEDKWVTPTMNDRDDNGLIVVEEDEGYDGLSRVVIDPQTIYNEGVEAGKAEGGEGGTCNLGTLDITLTDPYTVVKDASEDGYDGYNQVIVRPDTIIAQQREEAINEFKNQMQEITITENGTYSIDDTELVKSIAFDGNSYFDTGIVPTENIKIEVCIKVTDGNDAGMGGIIIGGGIDSVDSSNYNGTENRGIAIGMRAGAIYGIWGATRSWNNPYEYEKTTTVVLQKTDDSWEWESEKGSFGASTLYIGGYNMNGEEVEEKFTQSIVYIKIWTNRNDDSTLITYVPNTNGNFDANGVELQRLGDGTTTYVEENVNIYPNGFKRVEVNVECICPSTQETKWVTPSTNDVDDNGFIVIRPDDGYVAMDRVAMDVSTIKSEWLTMGKNSIADYYWCPLTVSDSGIGERAKSFSLADEQTIYDENDVLIDRNDMFYLPTANNLNEFRLTKKAVKIVFPFNDVDAQYISNLYLNDDVKVFSCMDKNLSVLSTIEVGKNVTSFVLSNCNLLRLNKIVVHSNNNCDVLLTYNVKSTGTLYINENNDFKNNWINALPSGWSVEYL